METVGELRPEYLKMIANAVISFDRIADVTRAISNIKAHAQIYQAIATGTGIPWDEIGDIHMREGGNNLGEDLIDGTPCDPATFIPDSIQKIHAWFDKTGYQVPAKWDAAERLYLAEKWNGFGPRHHGIHTGYSWATTNFYIKGKYDRNGHWDPNLVDKQVGIASVMLIMREQGIIQF